MPAQESPIHQIFVFGTSTVYRKSQDQSKPFCEIFSDFYSERSAMGFEGVIRRPSEETHQVRALDVLRTYLLINVSSGAQAPQNRR